MERIDSSITNYNHEIKLNERKTLIVSGVKKIENFDDEEFLMETTMGYLLVKGESLELIKLDTIAGDVSIKGKINALDYIEDNKTKESQGIFNRLFK
jgi:sporulation protein YabP